MFNKYDFIIEVCKLRDNTPDYNESMSNGDYQYYHGYMQALSDVCDLFDEFNN